MTQPLNLMLHCGAAEVSRSDLLLCNTPDPVDRWRPVSHIEFVEEIDKAMQHLDLEVVQQAHAIGRDGGHYFGLMQLKALNDADYSTVVGLRNSHLKDFGAQLVVGSGVFVCDNLAFSGEIKLSRKHTTTILDDLPNIILSGLQKMQQFEEQQTRRFTWYKQTPLSRREADLLLMEAFHNKVIPASTIGKVWDEWAHPSFPEFTEDGHTAWRMFNAFTTVLRGNLNALPTRTMRLQNVIDSYCDDFLDAA